MTGDEFAGLIVGIGFLCLAYWVLKGIIIWLYETFKIIARIAVGTAGAVGTYAFTQAMFGIPFTELTWTGVATGVALAILFPGASSGGSAPPPSA